MISITYLKNPTFSTTSHITEKHRAYVPPHPGPFASAKTHAFSLGHCNKLLGKYFEAKPARRTTCGLLTYGKWCQVNQVNLERDNAEENRKETTRLTNKVLCCWRTSWAPTQFLDNSRSWAHLKDKLADNSSSPEINASSAAVLRDVTSPFFANTLTAS